MCVKQFKMLIKIYMFWNLKKVNYKRCKNKPTFENTIRGTH